MRANITMKRWNSVTKEGKLETIELVLSKRNIQALLHKVDHPGSARTVLNNDNYINGEVAPVDLMLIVRCEPDAEHYAERDPGAMHPVTEKFINDAQ